MINRKHEVKIKDTKRPKQKKEETDLMVNLLCVTKKRLEDMIMIFINELAATLEDKGWEVDTLRNGTTCTF